MFILFVWLDAKMATSMKIALKKQRELNLTLWIQLQSF